MKGDTLLLVNSPSRETATRFRKRARQVVESGNHCFLHDLPIITQRRGWT